ncbi:MAG: tRNA (adenosine(37)-N6)-threonylcarbamoyltransferase complex ATPase subunit type 1 TsaE [Candidatus Obscuribacterales bacterium]|nr:tRNA (adenosine(37)-N6)-threonylcarbamoyltransferase complex ATPase subunit type 1 TsaE [Candidatus Obscuribacterales bacterium]
MEDSIEFKLQNAEATRKLGAVLGETIDSAVVIGLQGDLGAGKTTLTQGLAEKLGVEESVNSPTFLMLNEYHSGRMPLYHFDLYRLQEDIESGSAAMGNLEAELAEFMQSPKVAVVVEWLDLYEQFSAPYDELRVKLAYLPETESEGRSVVIKARGRGAELLLKAVKKEFNL